MAGIIDRRKLRVAGTQIAVGYKEEATKGILKTSISGGVIFSKTTPQTESFQLRVENIRLRMENEDLRAKVVAMQATNSAEEILEIREIPREQAKEEVRAFFKAHHGEAIYPSAVMEALSLDYDLVYEICEELEKEGNIKDYGQG